MVKQNEKAIEMKIVEIQRQSITFNVLGITPLIYNSMSLKTKLTLLIGSQPKTAAEKAATLKHNPLEEMYFSTYRRQGNQGPTKLVLPGQMFKAATREVALRMPGATKTAINQLVQVEEFMVDIYGIPELSMNVMRGADMNRTPDVRSRAIVPKWACSVTLKYVTPILNAHQISILFGAAGELMGVGDSRPQKGHSFGKFRVISEDDKEFQRIVKSTSLAKQETALRNPSFFDSETEQLFRMYEEVVGKRDSKLKEAAE